VRSWHQHHQKGDSPLRSQIRSAALVVAALVVAPLGALTACGSAGGAGAAAGGAAAPPAAASPAADSASPAGAPAHTVRICALISAAQAAKLTGQPYTVAAQQAGDWASQCAYNNGDATAQGVNVTLFTNAASTWSVVHRGDISDISGLGDKAFWDNDNTLYVMSGTDLVQVNGLSSEQDSEALAKPVLNALH
jgi:hypothetical protein